MQVTELENTKLKRSYRVVIESSRINKEMEAELKRAGERVKLPGFRPGNVPMTVLKQRYGKTVQPDVIKNVINDVSADMMEERKLRPATMPQINIETYPEDGDLTFTLDFEVIPEIEAVSFDAITLERPTFEITETDIDEALKRVAAHSPSLERAESGAKAEMGQMISIDFKGMIDGKAFAGGTASDFKLELGSKQFIDTFEEQLVGSKEGDDRIVKVTFPQNYHGKELAGKEASFAVTVKEIHNQVAPTVDDAFAKSHGLADLAALRSAIRDQMTKEYGQIVRRSLKKDLFDALEKKCDFELPQSMLESEFGTIWEQIKKARAEGDASLADKSEEDLKTEYGAIAARRVKLGLLLADIGQRNKIGVTNEEMNRAVMQYAAQFPGQEQKVFEFYRNNPRQLDHLRGPILEEKAVDFILEKVKYKDKKISLKELESSEVEEVADEEKKSAPKKAKTAKKKAAE
jgi:trigger factor